jgi:cytochrome c nitrite reductase small subunit
VNNATISYTLAVLNATLTVVDLPFVRRFLHLKDTRMAGDPQRAGSSRYWLAGLAVTFGILIGLSVFTFVYAEGFSYFSDDPNSCMNCHIMRDQFEGWNHSTHKAVATCNDCHTPHTNAVEKYLVKGLNGFNHSLKFTLGNFEEPIQITELNARVAHNSCVECHQTAVSQISHVTIEEPLSCVRCHGNVGHGNTAHGP